MRPGPFVVLGSLDEPLLVPVSAASASRNGRDPPERALTGVVACLAQAGERGVAHETGLDLTTGRTHGHPRAMEDARPLPPLGHVQLLRELARTGEDARVLRRALVRGELVRVRRGAYLGVARLDLDAQYDTRIAAVVGTRRYPLVLSHYSAARVWRLPIVNSWPLQVHATVPPESHRRSKNGVTIHRHVLAEVDRVEVDGYLVTSAARTLIDLARVASFRDGVAALDAALRTGLASTATLTEALDAQGAVQGRAQAARAIAFASPLATLPGESFSRVLMHELGFPAPVLQRPVATSRGHRFLDFSWQDSAGEFDGRSKYADPRYTGGATPDEIVWQEKLRENELRDAGIQRFTRWDWSDLVQISPFIARLESIGLRRQLPPGFAPPRTSSRSGG